MKKDAMEGNLDNNKAVPACEGWSEEDEMRLMHIGKITWQVSNVTAKMSNEERSDLKRKLERMEDKGDSPEVTTSVVLNLNKEITSTNPDEQPPLDQFEEEAVGDFAEAMM